MGWGGAQGRGISDGQCKHQDICHAALSRTRCYHGLSAHNGLGSLQLLSLDGSLGGMLLAPLTLLHLTHRHHLLATKPCQPDLLHWHLLHRRARERTLGVQTFSTFLHTPGCRLSAETLVRAAVDMYRFLPKSLCRTFTFLHMRRSASLLRDQNRTTSMYLQQSCCLAYSGVILTFSFLIAIMCLASLQHFTLQ